MSTKHILYTFRRCPYAMRARMALLACGIDYEWREIKLSNKPKSMLKISPKGTVPVLLRLDGQVLDESLEIMLWALTQEQAGLWITPGNRAEQLRWVQSNDRDFKYTLDRYKYPVRYQLHSGLPFREAGVAWLGHLERALKPSGYVCQADLQLVDVALFPFVRQFSRVEPDWFAALDLPAVQSWLKKCTDMPLFIDCMQKKPLWQE